MWIIWVFRVQSGFEDRDIGSSVEGDCSWGDVGWWVG
jgi:hypothetical protein